MNKTIKIQGQTIELPFTEAEYQKIVSNFQTQELDSAFSLLIESYGHHKRIAIAYLAIGLHLAGEAGEDVPKEFESALEQMAKKLYRTASRYDKLKSCTIYDEDTGNHFIVTTLLVLPQPPQILPIPHDSSL